jgi:predicted SprT family Zn-dependent metalloprotease
MSNKSLLFDTNLLNRLSKKWKLPNLYWSDLQLEWSPRLKKSLGIAYPGKRLARFNCLLKLDEYSYLLDEVVCHELAHLVAYDHEKKYLANHNSVWKELMTEAGFEPRLGLSIDDLRPVSMKQNRVLYAHTCPVCHASRASLKPNPSWICIGCRNVGFDGKLNIVSRPMSGGSR